MIMAQNLSQIILVTNIRTLQGVYNANSYIGIITDLSQVFLAIYDISISPSSYTGSENIDITNNEISLSFPLTINNEPFLNPRVSGYYEIYAAPNGISLLQHSSDGSQPIAIFNSLDKSVEFFGNLNIPNFYNKTEVDAIDDELSTLILNTYTKTEVEALISNINLTGSENIDITSNQFPLTFQKKKSLMKCQRSQKKIKSMLL